MSPGSEMWWDVVRSSPMYEAEHMLKHYRTSILEANPPGSSGYAAAALTVTRLNIEIHRNGQLQNRARLSQAVRNICGNETFERVMEEAARLEHFARKEMGVAPC